MYRMQTLMPWDAAALLRLTSNPIVTRYLGFRTHVSEDQASRLIRNYSRGPGPWFGVWHEDRLIGVAGEERQGHCVAAAIYFDPRARGAGRRFAVPWVRGVFNDPTVHRVFAHCHVDNIPVQRVLERMGATREGRMRKYAVFPNISPEPADCYLYSVVRGDPAIS